MELKELKIEKGEIREAFTALEELKNERSTNGKNALLEKYDGNRILKILFYYAFNSFKQYYIKQVPSPEPAVKDIDVENFKAFITLLQNLNDRALTDVKGHVEDFFRKCNETESTWYRQVLLRNLGIGMTRKGINKIYEGLIPAYDVLLAESIKDLTLTDAKTIARLPGAYVLQYKIDGYRLNIHKDDKGRIQIKTRSGLPVDGYGKLEEEARILLPKGYVYDGEMVSPNLFAWIEQNMLRDEGEKIADRSLFKDAVSKVFKKETNKQGIFNIFDVVKKSEWESQRGIQTYQERLSYLDTDVKGLLTSASQMTVVPTSRIFYKNKPEDLAETLRIFQKFLSWGWEGLMIKAVDAPYEWKRSKNIWKMKLMDTADLEVLGVAEGQGERAGSVGKLICDYKGTTLNIGTGKMTMDECVDYFKNPNLIVGKTIEVLYQAESVGKNGEPVLDFARYNRVRKDK